MSRILAAWRPAGTAAAIRGATASPVKTCGQIHYESEHRVFRDISNLPAGYAKLRRTGQSSFGGTKALGIKPWSENAAPCAGEINQRQEGTSNLRKLKNDPRGAEPYVRQGERGSIQDVLQDCYEPAGQECSMPPFGLHIAEDVEPMEFSALKEELASMEDTSPPKELSNPEVEQKNDPRITSEYSEEIYRYLRSREYKCVIPNGYLTGPAVTPNTRAVLVNWLVQVQVHLELSAETLHLTVMLMDRFLSQQPIGLNLLQLLGVTCLFVASKYEERFAPEVEVLCMLTDYTYAHKDVLLMERQILHALQFDLFSPTPMAFLETFLRVDTDDQQVDFHLANYLLDLALVDASVLKFYPSERAAAAACLARYLAGSGVDEDCWTADMVQKTGYTEQQLSACMARMARLVTEANRSPYKAVMEKFSSPTYGCVSNIQGPCLAKAEFLSDL
ncbi:G2/mitotic-specific cyclin-B2-like isoform X1 [Acanthaster planci]|uniref:G2/mitotic-specific cyclin-B2-like isoform X1 n=1 Tax=Acanthaster planci TaxID=133434 RepID=A0A8B7Y7X5_ACAPL|nr:G2/mitotic-specific cyclin-B2-like isoform X1 [Acanthaster planci]